jgi:hypothetical protein
MSDVLFLGNCSSANNRAKNKKPLKAKKVVMTRLQGKIYYLYNMVVLTLTGWACCLAAGMGL